MFPDRQNTKENHKLQDINQFLGETNDLFQYNARNKQRQVLMLAATNLPKKVDSAVW